jgi:gliding motility-associated-like protein
MKICPKRVIYSVTSLEPMKWVLVMLISTIPIIIQLINSPKYFKSNFNLLEYHWHAKSRRSKIIFDRYGKLLKQLYPNGPGWDGTYNGQPMPADDYWFYISYLEKGILKEYRSHFSLKDNP